MPNSKRLAGDIKLTLASASGQENSPISYTYFIQGQK
jgi:hypothetical protein